MSPGGTAFHYYEKKSNITVICIVLPYSECALTEMNSDISLQHNLTDGKSLTNTIWKIESLSH